MNILHSIKYISSTEGNSDEPLPGNEQDLAHSFLFWNVVGGKYQNKISLP